MKKLIHRCLFMGLLALASVMFSACEKEDGSFEELGKELDKAAEQTGEALEDAGKKIEKETKELQKETTNRFRAKPNR